jgi:hypothetical protein
VYALPMRLGDQSLRTFTMLRPLVVCSMINMMYPI